MVGVVEMDFHKIEAFHNGCLHRICRIFWPRIISNLELYAKTNSEPIKKAILRMSPNTITRVAHNGKESRADPKPLGERD